MAGYPGNKLWIEGNDIFSSNTYTWINTAENCCAPPNEPHTANLIFAGIL